MPPPDEVEMPMVAVPSTPVLRQRSPRPAAFALAMIALPALIVTGAGAGTQGPAPSAGDWPLYGRDPGGQRFSPLTQVTPGNVAR